MKTSVRKRAVAVLAATSAMVGFVMTVGAGSASAAVPTNVTFSVSDKQSDGSRSILIIDNGRSVGAGYWKANGDYLEAVDVFADGFGVAAYLSTNPVREASTYGHGSPYNTQKGGNLPEDKNYKFWVCFGGNAGQVCSDMYSVTS